MSSTIINLIIQLIAGAIGGNAAAAGMEQADLGRAGNTWGPWRYRWRTNSWRTRSGTCVGCGRS